MQLRQAVMESTSTDGSGISIGYPLAGSSDPVVGRADGAGIPEAVADSRVEHWWNASMREYQDSWYGNDARIYANAHRDTVAESGGSGDSILAFVARSWSETDAISHSMTPDRGYLGPQSEGDRIHAPDETNLSIPVISISTQWHAMVVGH
jgi:hypothetical protein